MTSFISSDGTSIHTSPKYWLQKTNFNCSEVFHHLPSVFGPWLSLWCLQGLCVDTNYYTWKFLLCICSFNAIVKQSISIFCLNSWIVSKVLKCTGYLDYASVLCVIDWIWIFRVSLSVDYYTSSCLISSSGQSKFMIATKWNGLNEQTYELCKSLSFEVFVKVEAYFSQWGRY